MVRIHLLSWRIGLKQCNWAEFVEEVRRLPADDQEVAAMLFGCWNQRDMLTVIVRFNDLEMFRAETILTEDRPDLVRHQHPGEHVSGSFEF